MSTISIASIRVSRCRRTTLISVLLSFFLILSFSFMTSARADLLQTIKDRGYMVVAVEADYAPFEFVQKGEIVGYDQDLLHAVMEGMPDVKLKLINLPWSGLLPSVAQKKADIVVSVLSVSKLRMKDYAMTLPVVDATNAFLKRADDNTIHSPEDLRGKRVGTQLGSVQLQVLQKYSKKLEGDAGKGIGKIVEYESYDDAYSDLLNKRIDAVGQAVASLQYVQKQRPNEFKVVLPTYGPKIYFSWALRNDAESKTLVDFINSRLLALNHDGTMGRIQTKWFGIDMKLPDHLPPPEI